MGNPLLVQEALLKVSPFHLGVLVAADDTELEAAATLLLRDYTWAGDGWVPKS